MKNIYHIEHRIHSLADCAVLESTSGPASFEVDNIKFEHWDFNFKDGWKTESWIASSNVEGENLDEAINTFLKKLSRIVPRIAFITQSYIEYIKEPFFVQKIDTDFIYFHYVYAFKAGGLMFMENEEKALNELLNYSEIPDAFYYYWNDAVNTIGYPSKLLLLFSAIESLPIKEGLTKWDLRYEILGHDIVKELWGTKEKPKTGLRHRLVHGEYFKDMDHSKNYFEIINNKFISYVNTEVLTEKFLQEDVVAPHRNPHENKNGGAMFLKNKDGSSSYNLKKLLSDFEESNHMKSDKYEYLHGEVVKSY